MQDYPKTFPHGRVALAAVFWLVSHAAFAGEHRLTLRAPEGIPGETPIALPAPDALSPGSYRLRLDLDPVSIPAVVAEHEGRKAIHFIAPEIRFVPPNPDGTISFVVEKDQADFEARKGVAFDAEGPNLSITIDDQLLTVHRVDAPFKPILQPLIGPSGTPVTRAYPIEKVAGEDVDHPHQASFWFTHGKVNGVDFWTIDQGTIRETSRDVQASGPVLGRLVTRNDWLDPQGLKVCEDERILTVHATADVRILDFEVTLKATDGPVLLGETKEGTFGIRVASTMNVDRKQGGKIRNAEGLEDAEAWAKTSAWVDYSGPVQGRTEGIAILNHPSSFRYPTTWHVRTYGLFAANPFGGHDFDIPEGYGEHTIAEGESLRFAYRIILHDGEADADDLARRFSLYAEAPEASWDEVD